MADKKIKITQIKSAIGYRRQAKDTLLALGIKKMILLSNSQKVAAGLKGFGLSVEKWESL